MAQYKSFNNLLLDIQAKISKLNAGNLSLKEIEELKELAADLYERAAILEFRAYEKKLSSSAAEEMNEEVDKVKEVTSAPSFNFSALKTEAPKPEVKPVITESKPVVPEVKPVIPEVKIPVAEPIPVAPVMHEPKIETAQVQERKPQQKELNFQSAPSNEPMSLMDKLKKSKIHDLKTAIPLNQKFIFMNYLFEGENSTYNDSIEKLNSFPDIHAARTYLKELAYIYNWNYEEEAVIQFIEMIERRYL